MFEQSTLRLALAGDDLYARVSNPDDIVRISKTGSPTSLGAHAPLELTATDAGLYYTTDTSVMFRPREAGAAIPFAVDQYYPGFVVVDRNRVCWTNQPRRNEPRIRAILCKRHDASDAGAELWQEGDIGNLLLDDGKVAFTRSKQEVLILDSPHASARELAKLDDVESLLGADARGLYLLTRGTYDGAVWRVPRTGGTPERLAHIAERVGCVLVDRETIYAASYHHRPGDLFGHGAALGTLSRYRMGDASAEPIASGLALCLGMAVDAKHVYVAGYEGISRAPR